MASAGDRDRACSSSATKAASAATRVSLLRAAPALILVEGRASEETAVVTPAGPESTVPAWTRVCEGTSTPTSRLSDEPNASASRAALVLVLLRAILLRSDTKALLLLLLLLLLDPNTIGVAAAGSVGAEATVAVIGSRAGRFFGGRPRFLFTTAGSAIDTLVPAAAAGCDSRFVSLMASNAAVARATISRWRGTGGRNGVANGTWRELEDELALTAVPSAGGRILGGRPSFFLMRGGGSDATGSVDSTGLFLGGRPSFFLMTSGCGTAGDTALGCGCDWGCSCGRILGGRPRFFFITGGSEPTGPVVAGADAGTADAADGVC